MKSGSGYAPVTETNLYKRVVALSDSIWQQVSRWDAFSKETIGKQLVRAADSIGANLCEGDGRYGPADTIRFFHIARGSGEEAKYWVERALSRSLLAETTAAPWLAELNELMKMLNGIIAHRRSSAHVLKEDVARYSESHDHHGT